MYKFVEQDVPSHHPLLVSLLVLNSRGARSGRVSHSSVKPSVQRSTAGGEQQQPADNRSRFKALRQSRQREGPAVVEATQKSTGKSRPLFLYACWEW